MGNWEICAMISRARGESDFPISSISLTARIMASNDIVGSFSFLAAFKARYFVERLLIPRREQTT